MLIVICVNGHSCVCVSTPYCAMSLCGGSGCVPFGESANMIFGGAYVKCVPHIMSSISIDRSFFKDVIV